MADIIAQNAKGATRKFTARQWDLLGKDKNGWTPLADVQIQNTAPVAKPSTGSKKVVEVVIDNVATKPAEVVIENKTEQTEAGEPSQTPVNFGELKDKFLEAAKDLRPGTIKDYFDKKGVKYKKNGKLPELLDELGQYLSYNIVELNKEFK